MVKPCKNCGMSKPSDREGVYCDDRRRIGARGIRCWRCSLWNGSVVDILAMVVGGISQLLARIALWLSSEWRNVRDSGTGKI
jgi:hypothetical protein